MRVAIVGFHSCIRAHKAGWELVRMGVDVHWVCGFISSTHSVNAYNSIHLFDSEEPEAMRSQLAEHIRILTPQVDVFHVYNEPNWIFTVVKENTDKPVIWDIHDISSIRDEQIKEEIFHEEHALEAADGFLVPSEGYYNRIPNDRPKFITYSCVGSWLFPENTEKKPGLVYEGGLKGTPIPGEIQCNYGYRDWSEFFREVADLGTKVYGYGANPEDFSPYKHENIVISPPINYNELINALSQHSVGLVGSPYPLKDFEDAMPNKLFEYVAAGIPCVVMNAPEAQRFVEKHRLGVGIRNASEAVEAIKTLTEHHIEVERWNWTGESQVLKVLGLYREVLSCRKPKNIAQKIYQ